MTPQQLLAKSKEMLDEVNQCRKDDSEIDINGNGRNAFEVYDAIKWYHDLITKYVKSAGGEPEKMYARLKENNDWEGETWCFYIPVQGNEKAIDKLRKLCEQLNEEEEFSCSIDDEFVPESAVDVLVKYGESGYFDDHNKLEGKLVLPKKMPTRITDKVRQDWSERMCKGGISEMMK